jgi:NitT/TauT family transport system substrate-binding protein
MDRNKSSAFSLVAVLSVFLLLLAWPSLGWGQKKDKVLLRDSWVFTTKTAALFLGKEKGFFAAEGIDLTMEPGRGSALNFKLLGAKKILFAIGNAATGARFITEGQPVKVVWGWYQTSPQCIVVHRNLGVKTPKDLEGRRLGDAPGSAGRAVFSALAKANGVNLSKVNWVNLTPAAKLTALLDGSVDAITTYFPDVPIIRSKGGSVDSLLFSDFGVNTLGTSISVHNSVLTEKADLLRRLLRGVSRTVQYALDHRDDVVAALKRAAPLVMKNTKIGRKSLDAYLTLLHTKNTQGKPLGWMAKKDWQETVDILSEYGGMKNPLPAEKYYTNAFVSSVSF